MADEKKKETQAGASPLWKSYEILIGMVIGLIMLVFQWSGIFERFELSMLDVRFLLRGPVKTDPRVVFVEMAEDGIAQIGRWPWSRDWHATLVSALTQYKPAAIVFDVLFTEPSREVETDDAFAAAIEEAKNVYLPLTLESPGQEISQRLYPIEKFRKGIHGTGHIEVVPDKDGIVRRVPLYEKRGGTLIPQLSFQVALDYLGINKEDVEVIPGKWVLLRKSGQEPIRIPIDKDYQMIINWAGPWTKTFKHLSYYETLVAYKQTQEKQKSILNLEDYKGKICLVGLTALGLFDTKPIPFETLHPMVGVHGNILSNIFQHNFVRNVAPWVNFFATVLCAVLVGCLVHWLHPLKGALASIGLLLLASLSAFYLFKGYGLIVQVVSPAFAIVFSYLGIVLYKYITEEKKKRWIKMAFSHYLSADVIDDIIRNPDQLKLGGERHVITVLFSDVRSFTTFSEQHTPEEVVHILNEYLDGMTKVILSNRGTIDKFVGDEIMALFGAPIRMEPKQQAYLAVRTAVEMVAALKKLHEKWQQEGKPLLGMGVGINTGDMICGNMGSTEIFDYTVIGDNVNIGARVEALTRKYDCDIIITESTYDLVADQVMAEKLDSILVKGKTKPITIYAVRGLKASLDSPIVTAK